MVTPAVLLPADGLDHEVSVAHRSAHVCIFGRSQRNLVIFSFRFAADDPRFAGIPLAGHVPRDR